MLLATLSSRLERFVVVVVVGGGGGGGGGIAMIRVKTSYTIPTLRYMILYSCAYNRKVKAAKQSRRYGMGVCDVLLHHYHL